jgi:single-strand DNA-binding protein
MALYENTIKLKGFLGKDAQTQTTDGGKNFTVLSLATKSSYKDKRTNEWVSRSEWHRINCFNQLDANARELKKGDYVEVEGELRSSEYDSAVGEGKTKTSVKRRSWEARAASLQLLSRPAKQGEENFDTDPITEDDAA